jgi:hypothetical protein
LKNIRNREGMPEANGKFSKQPLALYIGGFFFGWTGVGGKRGINYSISTEPFLRGLEGFLLS